MDLSIYNAKSLMQTEACRAELLKSNAVSCAYGLVLSSQDVNFLVENRFQALKGTGRVEFGDGIILKLVTAFCDSPFIMQEDYAETLSCLQEAFYYFKNECEDSISDDELIAYMKAVFNGIAQGSLEYLLGTSLEALCRDARNEGLI